MEIALRNRQRTVPVDIRRIKETMRGLSMHRFFINALPRPIVKHKNLEVGILFVNDRVIREMNKRFRGIDKVTDVLSFPLYDFTVVQPHQFIDSETLLLGDVLISAPQALRQSKEMGIPLQEELLRLVIHGLLHLIGYDHEGDRGEAVRMRRLENRLMTIVGQNDTKSD